MTDLSVDQNAGEQANVQQGSVGASEDGSVVYFVATGKLARGAEAGKDNLYVESETGCVVVVAAAGRGPLRRRWPDWEYVSRSSDVEGFAERAVSGVHVGAEPDGLRQPRREQRTARRGGVPVRRGDRRLRCVSCNPTGARPGGSFDDAKEGPLVDRASMWKGRWLAASIPGWTVPNTERQRYAMTYQSRLLSDKGRLFFDSADALVAAGHEWQRGCVRVRAAGGRAAARRSGGCVSLISSGTSGEESAFLDASESGETCSS